MNLAEQLLREHLSGMSSASSRAAILVKVHGSQKRSDRLTNARRDLRGKLPRCYKSSHDDI